MVASTTPTHLRVEQCRKNAHAKSERKRQAAFAALVTLQQEKQPITKALVARRARVSVVFLRSHPDLLQAIGEAEGKHPFAAAQSMPNDTAKDQVIAALRRRLDEMKQQVAAKDALLRQKQQEMDRLYGKLAAGNPVGHTLLQQKFPE